MNFINTKIHFAFFILLLSCNNSKTTKVDFSPFENIDFSIFENVWIDYTRGAKALKYYEYIYVGDDIHMKMYYLVYDTISDEYKIYSILDLENNERKNLKEKPISVKANLNFNICLDCLDQSFLFIKMGILNIAYQHEMDVVVITLRDKTELLYSKNIVDSAFFHKEGIRVKKINKHLFLKEEN